MADTGGAGGDGSPDTSGGDASAPVSADVAGAATSGTAAGTPTVTSRSLARALVPKDVTVTVGARDVDPVGSPVTPHSSDDDDDDDGDGFDDHDPDQEGDTPAEGVPRADSGVRRRGHTRSRRDSNTGPDGKPLSRSRKVANTLFPPLTWLPPYLSGGWRTELKGDLVAGLTVGCMLIPQGMAYALLAGLPPIYGLYASSLPLFLYPVFSTSRVQAIGPVAMDSLLTFSTMGVLLSSAELDNEELVVSLAIVLAFVTGVMQVLLGIFRGGIMVNFLSFSVMSGFTSAAALIIGLSQLKHVFGIPNVPRFTGAFANPKLLGEIVSRLDETNGYTLLLGAACIAMLLALRWYKRNKYDEKTAGLGGKILIQVAGFSALSVAVLGALWAIVYEAAGVAVRSSREVVGPNASATFVDVVGDVPAGLPTPAVPELSRHMGDKVDELLFGCAIIALIGFMELYAIGKVYAEERRYKLDANQELIALGAANILGSFFKGYPIGGSFSRTAVNAQAGANTLVACLVCGVIIVLALAVLAPAVFYIPMAALASIVEVAVLNLVKVGDFVEAYRLHKYGDLFTMVLTFVITFAFGIQQGIGLGVVMSIIFTVKHSAFPGMHELGQVPGTVVFRNIKVEPTAQRFPGVSVVRLDAELYFANTDFFRKRIMTRAKRYHAIVVDCSAVVNMDIQAIHMLSDLIDDLNKLEVQLYLAFVRAPVRRIMRRSGLYDKLGEEFIRRELSNAVALAVARVRSSGKVDDADLAEVAAPGGVPSPIVRTDPVSSNVLLGKWQLSSPGKSPGAGTDAVAELVLDGGSGAGAGVEVEAGAGDGDGDRAAAGGAEGDGHGDGNGDGKQDT